MRERTRARLLKEIHLRLKEIDEKARSASAGEMIPLAIRSTKLINIMLAAIGSTSNDVGDETPEQRAINSGAGVEESTIDIHSSLRPARWQASA